ncbi:MAG: hydantoinase B/oxoprolinase family protein [Candidatus Tectomicrobia bacterium]|nr:hydantoinase B/oxoprolinase family protein [Candidatus Tectomicrobia bacterium]
MAITNEMSVTLRRTSYSIILNEGNDYSVAIFDENADLVAMSPMGVPTHLGGMEFSVKACVGHIGKKNFEPGDIVVHNDPFSGGAHLPDINIILPVFHKGELVMFAASRGHHEDVGAMRPGSFSGDATSIFHEGLRMPPMKLFRRGRPNEELINVWLANVRTPRNTLGDMRAQIACCRVADARLREMFEKYGKRTVQGAIRWTMDYAERRMRAIVREWPNGTYVHEEFMDDDGINKGVPVKIRLKLTIKGSNITFDFSESDPQVAGPINACWSMVNSAVFVAMLNAVAPPEGYATEIANHGCYRPLRVIAPAGLVVNATYDRPVVGGNTETHQRMMDTVLGALTQVIPDKVYAQDMGTTNNCIAGGFDPRKKSKDKPLGEMYVWYQYPMGGTGGRATKDGPSVNGTKIAGHVSHSPQESFEIVDPWFVEEYSLVTDSGGPGRFRGGLSCQWKIRPVDHQAEFGFNAERSVIPPAGLFGGVPGLHADRRVYRRCSNAETLAADSVEVLESKTGGVPVRPEDLLYQRTPGGGGYGDPCDRDPQAVLEDVLDEYVSLEAAERDYGVVIDRERMTLDAERTRALRERLRKERPRNHVFLDQATRPYARRPFRQIRVAELPRDVQERLISTLKTVGHTVVSE